MRKRHLWLEMLILASMIVYIIENVRIAEKVQ